MDRRDFIGTSLAAAGAMSVAGTATRASAAGKQSVENTPVILECAINGSVTKAKNPRSPATAEEHSEEMIRCFNAGATIIHTHSNKPNEDPKKAAQFYIDSFRPVREKLPHSIFYATANFDPLVIHRTHKSWPGPIQCGHHRILAQAGLANMVLQDTGVVPLGAYAKDGLPDPDPAYFFYGFWPDDVRFVNQVCKDFGTGASLSVFEPGWMRNVIAMAKGGSLPRGSKLNIYFGSDQFPTMAPPIPEALELYLKMMEGFDLKWSVGYMGAKSVMDTPLAQLALERGGSFRVGIEDFATGPSNLDQIQRAKELINKVGRHVVTGAAAIKYLDIPFAATRPKD